MDVDPSNLEWLGPIVTAIGSVVVAAVAGAATVYRRRQDRQEHTEDAELSLQPKVTDGWEEVRQARQEATTYYNLYRVFENMYYTVAAALRHLARTIHAAHPDQKFDKDVVDALALKPPDTDAK